jgi:hypothetical protein
MPHFHKLLILFNFSVTLNYFELLTKYRTGSVVLLKKIGMFSHTFLAKL